VEWSGGPRSTKYASKATLRPLRILQTERRSVFHTPTAARWGIFAIYIYNVDPGHLVYFHSFEGSFVKIWAHDQSFRFATLSPGAITVFEVALTPNPHHKPVQTLDIPGNFNPLAQVFLPGLCRTAFIEDGEIVVFEQRTAKSFWKPETRVSVEASA
jgi:hypothetical protein